MPTRPAADPPSGLVVGFDLDMTLIDSRPGIKVVYDEIAARTGTAIDSDLVVSRLGPPVENELAHWFPPTQVESMADLYRSLYAAYAIDAVVAMPGAHAALAAVRGRDGRVVVITAKSAPHARLHLDRLALDVDDVHGRVWREGKAAALRAETADAYVGDHVHDMKAAHSAAVTGVGVCTGPSSGLELQQAGATAVLHSLLDFPEWLDDTFAD